MSKTRDGNHYVVDTKTLSTGLSSLGALAAKSTSSDSLFQQYDVVVIGAGYCGLVAARDLSITGKKVLLIEGRDRIGGRTFTYDFLQHKVELGGTWIHWGQPNLWSEISRYGLEQSLAESKVFSEPCEVSINFNDSDNSRPVLRDVQTMKSTMQRLIAAYFDVDGQGGRTIFPLPYAKMSNISAVRKYDNLSVGARLQQLVGFTQQEMTLLTANLTAFGSVPPAEQSFLTTLHYYALAGYDYDRLMSMIGRYKLAAGQSDLAARILGEYTGHAIFGKRVEAVNNHGGVVQVALASGDNITARQLICTVPVNCLSDIKFTPPLPPQFTKVKHPNFGGKIILHLDKRIPSWWGLVASPTPVDSLLTDKYSKRNGTFVVGFPPGCNPASNFRVVQDPETFLDHVQRLGVPPSWEARPTDLIWHDWNTDEFSKGQWASWGTGQFGSLKSLMEGANVSKEITLASADWADGWTGFIDGAIAQGRKSALRALSRLDSYKL
ncbi:uncharacterized protein A1O9_09900 [Exophiala aquamarina CBS 119918]|uniref:Amine oxidase n=1 Tax=Exophiala aquamarina CBS 119918 TaxID=1182545 RepID=A0A072PEU2_9EURO|nr:uncharacterized protein A1O9_09900 [Exophiala aquamarina CBS 119918]KEF54105.1 hypothetical protein A1O9_09900 [Exophiala aquamarina CBS 119918]